MNAVNLVDFTTVASLIDLMLEHWEISLAVLVAFTVLCIWLFKGVKSGFIATVFVACAAGGVFLVNLIVIFAQDDLEGAIGYSIAWFPTVLFVLILLVSTLTGVRRGLRKSLILLVHAVCAAGLCLGLFFFCISSPTVDGWMLDLVNFFMGGGNALQGSLGVSAECGTLREVLAEFIQVLAEGNREIGILLRDNGAYIMTLVDLGYRLAFAVVFWIVYQLLVFLLYLVYLIFYPERRYRKKKAIAFARNKTEISYKKRRAGGGIVGLCRGLVTGLISLSFLGSVFFIAAGGTGENKIAEMDFGNENANFAYSVYRSVESYGSQGIFKVLNAMKDPDDTPYYLFAADLVFSGGLDDEKHGISENIRFRKELGAYTGFAKDTFNLLLKYGGEDLTPILRGESSSDAMDVILSVTKNPEFQLEFENLVDNFDAQTYFINFSLSLVDSVIANIDDMSFASSVSADNRELLKVLFQRGYLSDTIPDERERKALLGSSVAETDAPPCFNVTQLFTKRDAQSILRVVLSLISGEMSVSEPLTLAQQLMGELENLSILGTARSEEVNPVFGRLYCYLENKYLTAEGQSGITYSEIASENVEWTREIRALLGVSDELFTLYENVRGKGSALDMVLSVFDETDEHYEQNIRAYDGVCDTLADSRLLGKVLGSGKAANVLRTALQSVGEGFYLPDKIVYENVYDGTGALVSHGEAYTLLRGLRLFGDKQNRALLDSILGGETEITDILQDLADAVARKDTLGNSLSDYLTESVLLRSVISTVVLERADGMIAVPTLSLEKDAQLQPVHLINKAELKEIFDALPNVVSLLLPLAEEELSSEAITALLEDETLNGLLESGNKIVEGTVANALIERLNGNETIVIPRRLLDFEEWVTYGEAGELRKTLASIRILQLDVTGILEEGISGSEMIDIIRELERAEVEEMLESDVMHYTISKLLGEQSFGYGEFRVIIPASSRVPLYDDVLEGVISKSELIVIFSELKELGLSSEMSAAEIVTLLVKRQELINDSRIISASVVNFLCTNDSVCDALNIPERYLAAATLSQLEKYDASNPWRAELPALIIALDEIFDISAGAEFSLDRNAISEKMNELLRTMNKPSALFPERTKLDVCYDSAIIRNDITVELDEALTGVVADDVLAEAKPNGYYSLEEIRALSDAADLFGLDLMTLTGNELTEKIKDEMMRLNEPRADYEGRTALEVIYPSSIIRRIMTDELDKSLGADVIDGGVRDGLKYGSVYPEREIATLIDGIQAIGISSIDAIASHDFADLSVYRNNLDDVYGSGVLTGVLAKQLDDALTEDIIERTVRGQIKSGQIYPKAEISTLLDALDELGIGSLDAVDSYDFALLGSFNAPAATRPDATRLDVLYDSRIMGGIITHAVRDGIAESEGKLCDHPDAYLPDIRILKKTEIECLVSVAGGDKVGDYQVGQVNLADLRAYIVPDEEGKPRSAIISASISANLMANDALVIPSSVVSGGTIESGELVRFLDAFTGKQGSNSLDDWEVSGDMTLPSADDRERMAESEIMRATLSRRIVELNSGIVFRRENVVLGEDHRNRPIAVIEKDQLLALFTALEVCGADGGSELNVPAFNSIHAVAQYSDRIGELYAVDEIRYRISATVKSYAEEIGRWDTQTEDCFRLTLNAGSLVWESTVREAIALDSLQAVLERFA